jgi:hypothetical protein|tara:strand:- start:99 stop:371 length:273 start_codon:yes stop_codon:yes gene_type:complete
MELTTQEKADALAALDTEIGTPSPDGSEYTQVKRYESGGRHFGVDACTYQGEHGYIRFVEATAGDGEPWRYDDVHIGDGRTSGWYSLEIE